MIRHANWLIGTMATCLFLTPAGAQNGGAITSSRGSTSAEALRSYGVELSEQSLLVALCNVNPKIRALAADQLSHDHHFDAIPAIERAFSIEKDPMTRVGIAAALVAMHDPTGAEHLQTMCSDPAQSIRIVFEATQMLQLFGQSSGGCAAAILGSVNRVGDADYRAVVLSLLPTIYREVPGNQTNRIVSVIENLLSDETQQPAVIIAASSALSQIGSASSVEVVRGAIVREKEPAVRASLEEDLAALEKKY
jgi:HEAT repeat protein